MATHNITIELTSEELLEVRFCVKRYCDLYKNYPNEYIEGLRQSAIDKFTTAFVEWQDQIELDDDNS